MDPFTAGLTALGKFSDFLCTPAGQRLADDNRAVAVKLLSLFGVHLEENAPAPKS